MITGKIDKMFAESDNKLTSKVAICISRKLIPNNVMKKYIYIFQKAKI